MYVVRFVISLWFLVIHFYDFELLHGINLRLYILIIDFCDFQRALSGPFQTFSFLLPLADLAATTHPSYLSVKPSNVGETHHKAISCRVWSSRGLCMLQGVQLIFTNASLSHFSAPGILMIVLANFISDPLWVCIDQSSCQCR